MSNDLLVEKSNGILKLIMNRPERRNAMSDEMLNDMLNELNKASFDNSIRVIVLTGAGNAFCAGGDVKEIGQGKLDASGHISYLPGEEWILNDTYPKGQDRMQTPHLYHVKSERRVDLGQFHLPKVYTGEWRVDTHPRFSPDSRYVCIDAPHQGQGRQLHLIDIAGLLERG